MGNFFDFLLGGVLAIMQIAIAAFPLATSGLIPIPLLNAVPTLLFTVAGVVLFFVGPFLNLAVFSIGLIAMLGAEIIRLVLAVYRFILKLIPAAS